MPVDDGVAAGLQSGVVAGRQRRDRRRRAVCVAMGGGCGQAVERAEGEAVVAGAAD